MERLTEECTKAAKNRYFLAMLIWGGKRAVVEGQAIMASPLSNKSTKRTDQELGVSHLGPRGEGGIFPSEREIEMSS